MRISDWSSDVCSSDLVEQAQEDVDKTSAVGIAAGNGRLFGREVEQGENRAPSLVERGFGAACFDAFAHRLVVASLRLGLNFPQRRPDDGVGAHQAQRALGMMAKRGAHGGVAVQVRSEEHASELQSRTRDSNAVFCWKKKT